MFLANRFQSIKVWGTVTLKMMVVLTIASSLQGCVGALIAPRPLTVSELMMPDKNTLSLRSIQAHRIDDVPESVLRAAAMSVIQGLGYQVIVSDVELGLLIGVRGRQPFNDFLHGLGQGELALLKWELTLGFLPPPPDPGLTIFNATSVIFTILPTPELGNQSHIVKIQFHRISRRISDQSIFWAEVIKKEEDYERYFSLLRNAVALEATNK